MSRNWASPGVPGATSMPTSPWTSKLVPVDGIESFTASFSDWLMPRILRRSRRYGGFCTADTSGSFDFPPADVWLVRLESRVGRVKGQAASPDVPAGSYGQHGDDGRSPAEAAGVRAANSAQYAPSHRTRQHAADVPSFGPESTLVADDLADLSFGYPLGPRAPQHVAEGSALCGDEVADQGSRFVHHAASWRTYGCPDADFCLLTAQGQGILPAEGRVETAHDFPDLGTEGHVGADDVAPFGSHPWHPPVRAANDPVQFLAEVVRATGFPFRHNAPAHGQDVGVVVEGRQPFQPVRGR